MRYAKEVALGTVAAGCIVVFCGLASVSLPAALIVLSGAALIAVGALVIEVPQP